MRSVYAMRLSATEHGVYVWLMGKTRKPERATYRRTYIEAWRKYRGLSQVQLEHRMERAPGEPLISRVSIGRIEKGLQPYSQPILEALAEALDCTPSDLLEVNPMKDGEVVDLMRILRSMDHAKLGQIAKIAKAIA